ncbi:MAG: hypothetical protein QOJ03_31 [Frankiaceae bacterium]|jgi:hypothetical protein|nr:hypothetical protein [Frankiaceae bacterium]
MRRGLVLGGLLGLLNGVGALVAARWLTRQTDVGWFAYSPMPRRYADYLVAPESRSWTPVVLVLLGFILANGLALGAFIARSRRPSRGHGLG